MRLHSDDEWWQNGNDGDEEDGESEKEREERMLLAVGTQNFPERCRCLRSDHSFSVSSLEAHSPPVTSIIHCATGHAHVLQQNAPPSPVPPSRDRHTFSRGWTPVSLVASWVEFSGLEWRSNTLPPSRRLARWTCMVHRENITTRRQESNGILLPQPRHHLSHPTPSLSSSTPKKSLQTSRRLVKPREHSGPQLLVCEVVLLYLALECDMWADISTRSLPRAKLFHWCKSLRVKSPTIKSQTNQNPGCVCVCVCSIVNIVKYWCIDITPSPGYGDKAVVWMNPRACVR